MGTLAGDRPAGAAEKIHPVDPSEIDFGGTELRFRGWSVFLQLNSHRVGYGNVPRSEDAQVGHPCS